MYGYLRAKFAGRDRQTKFFIQKVALALTVSRHAKIELDPVAQLDRVSAF